jgi:UDP-2,3-diacylglucosamine hydrolase
MSDIFISDLHLDESRPEMVRVFLRFLADFPAEAEKLYILGDFFEVWIGDNEKTDLQLRVAKALKALSETGVSIYFMPGNRDFLLGRRYAKRAGMTLIKDPTIIERFGKRLVLMHGDTLCADDEAYQRFRQKARNPLLKCLFLSLPLYYRRKIAARARAKSKAHTQSTTHEIMDVNQEAVFKAFKELDASVMIHGHTHRPAKHDTPLGPRYVLASWENRGDALCLKDDGQFIRMTLPA